MDSLPVASSSTQASDPNQPRSSRGRRGPKRPAVEGRPPRFEDAEGADSRRGGRRGPGRGRGRGSGAAGGHAQPNSGDVIRVTTRAADGPAVDVTSAPQQLEATMESLRLSSPRIDPNIETTATNGVSKPGSNPRNRRSRNRNGPRPVDEGAGASHARRDASTGPSAAASEASVEDGPSNIINTLRPPPESRRKRFGAQLTSGEPTASTHDHGSASHSHSHSHDAPLPSADLTTRLTYSLTHPPYADCPICFSPIHPVQPTWSCSLAADVTTCCWTPFHMKCIREWAGKSMHETKEAWRTRGEDRPGEWRCPGCQTRRFVTPGSYRCFCGRMVDPNPGRLGTPHSCAAHCSRPRKTCEHPCPLLCHPGPCPSCITTVQRPCYCGRKSLSMRCSHLTASVPPSLSCGGTCRKTLSCGKHLCSRECHPGECDACEVNEVVRCYCGKNTTEVACGEGESKACKEVREHGEFAWEGRFQCDSPCDRPFKCGVHHCEKSCHPPPLTPSLCPTDPSVIITCPCGKTMIETLPNGHRKACTDPIPICRSICSKALPDCSHTCSQLCHTGPCPPCTAAISLACRCGETVKVVQCHVRQAEEATGINEVLCDKPCRALRHCGRHACSRVCCPLAWQGKVAKGKRKALETALLGRPEDDTEGWHDCDIVCGKLLACRNHNCNMPDHRGPCPTCLLSSFDEMVCHCGRTVLMPPIPCGTQIECNYPCSRPPPPCGHPKATHTCHEEGDCPPCPYLARKPCACGKVIVPNIRCSQEKVSCGIACGKPLECGFHSCEKTCHSGPCEACTQVCGKPRKLCSHPCPIRCHAPSACPEDDSCPARVTVTCACGRIKQTVLCGTCVAQPASRETQQLKCVSECQLAKRNARLAEALGISDTHKSLASVEWPEQLVSFFKANREFGIVAERNLNDFVTSQRKQQTLPVMAVNRTRFVHDMALVYRINATYLDKGTNLSLQLVRRQDTRIPSPSLSDTAEPQPVRQSGAMVDLKKRDNTMAAPPRGWASMVAAPSVASPRSQPVTSVPVTVTPSPPQVPVSMPRVPLVAATPAPSSAVRESWEDE